MHYYISPLATLVLLVVALLVGWQVGDKRRIGFGWSFFFTTFWIIPGIIITFTSPLKHNLKPPPAEDPNKTFNTVTGVVLLLLGSLSIYSAFNTPSWLEAANREDSTIYKYITGGYFLISSYYMFTRSQRHRDVFIEVTNPPKESDKNLLIEEKECEFIPEESNYEIAEREYNERKNKKKNEKSNPK